MARKKISDFLQGSFTGATAGTGALGGLAQAGIIGSAAVNPWAWGLMGGGALLGGITSLLADEPEKPRSQVLSEQLMEQQLEAGQMDMADRRRQRSRTRRIEKGLGRLNQNFFRGAGMARNRASAQPLSAQIMRG